MTNKPRKGVNHAEDNSPYVHQKPVLKEPVALRQLPWTDKQLGFIELAEMKETQVIFAKGPAGTSKTALSIYCLLSLLNAKKISDLVLVRSIVESSDNKMGFLPGTSEEKMHPYMIPFMDKMDMFLTKNDTQKLHTQERITAMPINFLRGMDWQRKGIVLDEAQNMTRKELLTFMTRIGKFCKTFIIGDPEQSDIKNSAFNVVFDAFDTMEARRAGIYCVEFDESDIMRSDLCKFIATQFKSIK